MPEFDDLNGNRVKMEPAKLTLVSGKTGHAVIRQEGGATRFTGTIDVECDSAVAFSEIVSRLTHQADQLKALEDLAIFVYHRPAPFDRLTIVRKIQEIYYHLTGWHLSGVPFMKPRSEGISMQVWREGAGRGLPDGVPCSPGCLGHISHPCEKCGRIGGKRQPADECSLCKSKMTLASVISEGGTSYTLSCPTEGCGNNLTQRFPADRVKLLPEVTK